MYKVLVTEPEYFGEDSIKILKKIGRVRAERLTPKQLSQEIRDIDVLIVRIETHLDKTLLGKAKKLKVIGSATTGLDHIDVECAKKLGIEVINLHGTHTVSTAEHTFALMLSLARKIPWAFESIKEGKWQRYKFFGTQLEGKTLGIVGLGRIGSKVASYASSFGMRVVAYDPYVSSPNVRMVSLNELLKSSDVITVNALLTKETENLISYNQFKLAKKGALMINTSRGRIVNEKALLASLKSKRLGGAALDVYDEEPRVSSIMLAYAVKNENLLLTPHLGASTNEAIRMAGVEIATNVRHFMDSLG